MASRLDFNSVLAKADKNSSYAQRLLEEKKLQHKLEEQKKQQQAREKLTASLAKSKEEAREKIINTEQQRSKPATTATAAGSIVSKNIQTKKASNEATNKNASGTVQVSDKSNNKPVVSKKAQQTAKTQPAQPQPSKPAPSVKPQPKPALTYEQMLALADNVNKEKPKESLPQSKQSKSEIVSKSITTAQTPIGQPVKPKPTLNNKQSNKSEALNRISAPAQQLRQPGAVAKSSIAEKPVKSSPAQQISSNPQTSTSSSSSLLSKLTPEQITKLKLKSGLAKSQQPPSLPRSLSSTRISSSSSDLNNNVNKRSSLNSTSVTSKLAHPKVPQAQPKRSMSDWDRITSSVRKKQVKSKQRERDDEEDYYEDEDEYDSDMEDFIDDSEEDTGEYRSQIRRMFNYNPNKYKDEDDDIDNMETDYHSQLKEEKRSLKLGILEDNIEKEREEAEKKRRIERKKRQTEAEYNEEKKLKK